MGGSENSRLNLIVPLMFLDIGENLVDAWAKEETALINLQVERRIFLQPVVVLLAFLLQLK